MDRGRPRALLRLVAGVLGALSALGASPAPLQLSAASAGPALHGTPPLDRSRAPRMSSDGDERVHPDSRFTWPLSPRPALGRPFQPPSHPYGPGHRGVDLVGVAGQPVLAPADGVVVYAGQLAGRGVVSIDHADGLRTSYEPVAPRVRSGQVVHRGEAIGSLEGGHPGCPHAACLHWGLRRDGGYLDPLLLVRGGHVRLLPWPRESQAGRSGQ
jgi:murein DD-endopeptidase MepM/ murein hydrolase activator NlpD